MAGRRDKTRITPRQYRYYYLLYTANDKSFVCKNPKIVNLTALFPKSPAARRCGESARAVGKRA